MAIEDEKEPHTTWGTVAAHWYTMASDRHPNIGRLNHHLGILERPSLPSLRKLFLYTKALTCVIPFPNARDSLDTLCGPIIQDERAIQKGNSHAEASIVSFFAQVFSASDSGNASSTASNALSRLGRQKVAIIRDIGVSLVVTNIAALLELGAATNLLWQSFGKSINTVVRSSRPSTAAPGYLGPSNAADNGRSLAGTHSTSLVHGFCYASFNTIIAHQPDRHSVRDTLPSVHAILVWFRSLHTLSSWVKNDSTSDAIRMLLSPDRFSWAGLCGFLNTLAQQEPTSARTVEYARQGIFVIPERSDDTPLAEDFLIRGLIWTQFYFPSGWFDKQDEDSRAGRGIETDSSRKNRVERVQWLALYLAFHTEYIKYDMNTRSFWAPVPGPALPVELPKGKLVPQKRIRRTSEPTSQASTTPSTESDGEGYPIVSAPERKPARTWANVASMPKAASKNYSGVKIFDEESVQ